MLPDAGKAAGLASGGIQAALLAPLNASGGEAMQVLFGAVWTEWSGSRFQGLAEYKKRPPELAHLQRSTRPSFDASKDCSRLPDSDRWRAVWIGSALRSALIFYNQREQQEHDQ